MSGLIRRAAAANALLIVGIVALWAHVAQAQAVDPNLCGRQGETEVPPFADGRNSDGCLLVDPGNGEAPIRFQYEQYHRSGPAGKINFVYDRCPGGKPCTQIAWDITIDNYLSQTAGNRDGAFIGAKERWQYLYFKDVKIINNWQCQGGTGWTGPNGIHCDPGEDSDAHVDNVQFRGQPNDDGWVIFQDSVVSNGHTILFFLEGVPPVSGRLGSALLQGTRLSQLSTPLGQSKNWIKDCFDRGENASTCRGNRGHIFGRGARYNQVWLVDVFGNVEVSVLDDIDTVIVVNTGCGEKCDGNIQYHNGWPHPLSVRTPVGPNSCPNGRIPSWTPGLRNVFCYTSLENALKDHKAPPFVHLSSAGWENPPTGGSTPPGPDPAARPAPPLLIDVK